MFYQNSQNLCAATINRSYLDNKYLEGVMFLSLLKVLFIRMVKFDDIYKNFISFSKTEFVNEKNSARSSLYVYHVSSLLSQILILSF